MLTNFPKTNYIIDGVMYELANITTNVILQASNIDRMVMFNRYTLNDTETPESVSETIYGTAEYWWVIVLINNIVNPFTDWVMDSDTLLKYASDKYTDPYSVKHYYNSQTNRIEDDYNTLTWRATNNEDLPEYIIPITHIQYEQDLNIKRQFIIVVSPMYISKFVETYNSLVNSEYENSTI